MLPAHILVFYSLMQLAYREMAFQAPGPMQLLENAQTSLRIWSEWTTCRLLTPASWVLASCKSHHRHHSPGPEYLQQGPQSQDHKSQCHLHHPFQEPQKQIPVYYWDKQLYPSSNRILTPPTGLSWPCLPTATWPLTQTGDIRWVTRGTFHLHNNTLFPNEYFPEASAYCPTSKDWANTRPRLRQWCFHSPACMLTMAARVCHYHHSDLHVDDKDIGSWPHHYSQTQQPHAAMQHCNTMTAGTKKWRWVCPCSMISCNLCRNMHPICILAKAQPKVVRQLISCTYKDLIQTSQSVPPAPWWFCIAIAAGQAHICPEGPQVQDGQSAWQEGPADWWQLFRPAGQHHSPLLIT